MEKSPTPPVKAPVAEKKPVKPTQPVQEYAQVKQRDLPRHQDNKGIHYKWSSTMDGVQVIDGIHVMNFQMVKVPEQNSTGQTVYREVRMTHSEAAVFKAKQKQEQKNQNTEAIAKPIVPEKVVENKKPGAESPLIDKSIIAKTEDAATPPVKIATDQTANTVVQKPKSGIGVKTNSSAATTTLSRPQGGLKLASAVTTLNANTGIVSTGQINKAATNNQVNALGGLKQTPASELGIAYNQVEDNSKTSLTIQAIQKQDALNHIPQISEAEGSAHNFSQKQNTNKIKAKGKTAEAKNIHVGKGGFKPPIMHEVKVPAPPFHFIPPFVMEPGVKDVNPDQAQGLLHNLHLGATNMPVDMGPAPELDLHGEADLNNIHQEQHEQAHDVNVAKNETAKEIHNDFGENSVIKDPGSNVLKTNHQMKAVVFNAKTINSKVELDADTTAKLDLNMAGLVHDKIGAQEEKNNLKKAEYDNRSEAERTKADGQIADEKSKSKQEQLNQQNLAQKQVGEHRQEWRDELEKTEKDFNVKADGASKEYITKINTEKVNGESEAHKHIEEGNQKAAEKKTEATAKADVEKEKSEGESKGFFGWLADKASALISKLKEGLNFIFEQLRAAVKWIFEQAKKLALAALELARKAVVGLIKVFGAVLKAFVSVAFAAFPAIRDRINAKIDVVVNKAVQLANKVFEVFKKVVAAIIDVLAKVVDTLLAAYQAFYNFLLDAVDFIVAGIIKIMQGITNLVKAAKQSPEHFLSQLSLEVLGTDITMPLVNEIGYDATKDESKVGEGFELAKRLGFGGEEGAKEGKGVVHDRRLKEGEVTSDDVVSGFTLDPGLQEELLAKGDGETEFGQTPANDNILNEARKEEAEANALESPAAAPKIAEVQQSTEDKAGPFKSPAERGAYVVKQMTDGIAKWWAKNKVKVIAGVIGGLLAGALLEVVTGGAVTAALPVLMDIMAAVFGLNDILDAAFFVGQYVTKSWIGQLALGAMSLARSFAKLIIAIISDVIGGGEMIKGAKKTIKAAEKGGAKGVLKLATGSAKKAIGKQIKNVKELAKIASEGGKVAWKNGKMVLSSVRGALKRGAKTLGELSAGLLKRFRFKKFKLVVKGFRFYFFGEVNPWVLLADGSLKNIKQEKLKTLTGESKMLKVGDEIMIDGKKGFVVGSHSEISTYVEDLKKMKRKEGKVGLQKEFQELEQAQKDKGTIKEVIYQKQGTYELRAGIGTVKPKDFQAHHIIPRETQKEFGDFFKKIGFNIEDGKINGIMVPPSKEVLQEALKDSENAIFKNSAVHLASHGDYTRIIEEKLRRVKISYEKGLFLSSEANEEVLAITVKAKNAIRNGGGISINQITF